MSSRTDPFNNAGSDRDALPRRTGGSANDPHGGRETGTRRHPDPDPLAELATIDDAGRDNDPDRPRVANRAGHKPGFGPDELTPAALEGGPELGIDARNVAAPTRRGR